MVSGAMRKIFSEYGVAISPATGSFFIAAGKLQAEDLPASRSAAPRRQMISVVAGVSEIIRLAGAVRDAAPADVRISEQIKNGKIF